MPTTVPVPEKRRSTGGLLIAAAERLIAEHGVHGVSMRQIAVAAGQANAGVTQYHFGSLDGLLDAILLARVPAINARRHELVAYLAISGRLDELRGLVEAIVLPLAEVADHTPYVTFLSRLLDHRADFSGMAPSDDALVSGVNVVAEHIRRIVEHVPARVLEARILTAYGFAVHSLGLHHRAEVRGDHRARGLIDTPGLIDMLTAALDAPHTGRV